MLISFNLLNQFSGLTHFCTTREGGVSEGDYASLNLSPYSGDNIDCFRENKRRFCEKTGIRERDLIIPFQTHGTEILEIDDHFLRSDEILQQKMLYGVDALYTKKKNIYLGITTADCVPLIFYDAKKQVIAAAHAGWRGTCSRIAEKVIGTLNEKFNSCPEDIFVLVGPSISAEVYRVGEELVAKFEERGFPVAFIFKEINQHLHLDLWEANRWLLKQNCVPEEQIEISGICTYSESERFFSARKLGIKSGRILSGIMLN